MPPDDSLGRAARFKSAKWHDSGMTYVGRFAPSPTGTLHWGSLFTALASWLEARAAGGRWLLRIEDIDPPRAVPGASAAQLHALHRLGLDPDAEPWRQSQRTAAYAAALRQLVAAGHAYPCACTRADLDAYAGTHPPQCVRPLRADAAQAWRLRVPRGVIAFDDRLQGPQQQDVRAAVGDFVLRRTDGLWAYQLAVVVDDAAQGVTDVVRGADLLDSTPRQILLQRLLQLPTPRYLHVPLLLDAAGRKLSKSAGATALPDNALRVLRVALALLGQHAAARHPAHDVTCLLRHACVHYQSGSLPRARTIAAPQSAVTQATRTLAGKPSTRSAT